MGKSEGYKIFISYSWTTQEHEIWVYNLATRLMENGIEVVLDKWDLKPGQDKFKFMESMVQDESVDKVLIICDKGYKDKADSRTGGVGTETQIITPEIYNKTRQNKFIPIITEKGDTFDAYLPQYLKSRIAIDMSTEDVYEKGYEDLLRDIYERPQFRKPAKGEPPAFIFEDEKSHFKTKNLNRQLKHMLINKPNQAYLSIKEFINEFIKSLKEFEINDRDFKEPYDEQIYNNINDMIILRDDYVEFLSLLCQLIEDFNVEIVIELFEEIYSFTRFSGTGVYNDIQFDHYRFFITELFLYTAVVLMDNKKYEDLDVLLSTKYFIEDMYGDNGRNFSYFRFYIRSIEELRNSRLQLRKYSLTGDLLVQRSIINDINYREKLLDADLILYYISTIKFDDDPYWFPTTYIYKKGRVDILKKMVRKRHFENVKCLFGVKNEAEMIKLINNYDNVYEDGFRSSFERIKHIKNHVEIDEIGKF